MKSFINKIREDLIEKNKIKRKLNVISYKSEDVFQDIGPSKQVSRKSKKIKKNSGKGLDEKLKHKKRVREVNLVLNHSLSPSKNELDQIYVPKVEPYFLNDDTSNTPNELIQNNSSLDSENSDSDFDITKFINNYSYNTSTNSLLSESNIDFFKHVETDLNSSVIHADNSLTESNGNLTKDNQIKNRQKVNLNKQQLDREKNTKDMSTQTTIQYSEINESLMDTNIMDDNLIMDDTNIEPETIQVETNKKIEIEIKKKIYDFYNVDNFKIVVIKKGEPLPVHGIVQIKVLYGVLKIFGHSKTSSSDPFSIISPRGSALFLLENGSQVKERHIEQIQNMVPELRNYSELFNKSTQFNSLIIKCMMAEDFNLNYFENYVSQQMFPKSEDVLPNVVFDPQDNFNLLKIKAQWNNILEKIVSGTKLMLTGGKGVGKSTCLRYCINRLLEKYDSVRVIDLDPGQAEFTVPGCISVLNVTEPVCKPSYFCTFKAERSILTDIDVGQNKDAYLNAVYSLITYCGNTLPSDVPILINFMGFVDDLGFLIVSEVIKILEPTTVIQINSKKESKNYNMKLSPENIDSSLTHSLKIINSATDDNDGFKLQARQVRELKILNYFAKMLNADVKSLVDSRVTLRELSLSSVEFESRCGEKLVNPDMVINANLVALCSESNNSTRICHGWGIIRGIDRSNEKIIIITPESTMDLNLINIMVVGVLSLPPAILMVTDDISGRIPYVCSGDTVQLGGFVKRCYIPANKGRS